MILLQIELLYCVMKVACSLALVLVNLTSILTLFGKFHEVTLNAAAKWPQAG